MNNKFKILSAILIILIAPNFALAQNGRRPGLSQLEFDQKNAPKSTPVPNRSLNPEEAIYKILNNQKQINEINSDKKPVDSPSSSEQKLPPAKKSKGLSQLD